MGRVKVFVPQQLFIIKKKKHVTQPGPPTQRPPGRLPLPLQTSHVIAFLACHLLDNHTQNFTFIRALRLQGYQATCFLLSHFLLPSDGPERRESLVLARGLFQPNLNIGITSHTKNLLQLSVTAPQH